MNKLLTLLILLILIPLSLSPASAEDTYNAKIQIEISQVNNGVTSWSAPITFDLNKTDSKSIYGISVNYADIGNSNSLILLRIAGGSTSDVAMAKNQQACIKGTCVMNISLPINVGDVRITLMDIIKSSAYSSTTTTSDNIVELYVLCSSGERLILDRDSPNNYNPTLCVSKTGWSTTSSKNLIMYMKRNVITPISLNVVTNGGYKEEIVDVNTRKYTITSNEVYTFNVKATTQDIWGGNIEKLNTYTLTVAGLGSTSSVPSTPSTSPSTPTKSYSVFTGERQEITLQPGSFDEDPSFTASQLSSTPDKSIWELSFFESGITSTTYNPKTGTPFSIEFRVSDRPTPKVTEAAQTPPLTSYSDTILYIIIVLLIIAAAIYYLKVKKSPSRERKITTREP
jgi:hypothetical protein